MEWKIKHIFNFKKDRLWGSGYAFFGFHGKKGDQYLLQWDEHWLGHLNKDNRFTWTAGSVNKGLSENHIDIDVKNPHYISEAPDGSLILSSNGNNKIFKIYPDRKSAELFIDTGELGFVDVGNCLYDRNNTLWIHEIKGCKVWQFDVNGKPIRTLGNGTPDFQQEPVSFNEVRFNWIYDLRIGPNGNMYVLDSKNFAVRMIDIANEIVTTVVGTGESGYTGDGGNALEATLGSNKDVYFDGPLSLSLDEDGNLFIGDTQNHAVRMVERSSKIITTIAGKRDFQSHTRNDPQEKDPLRLNLPWIASLDYYDCCLFIPEDDGDLIVLEKA